MAVRETLPKEGYTRRFEVDSFTHSGQHYVVALNLNGNWECSCPVYIYRRRQCKHVDLVLSTLGTGVRGSGSDRRRPHRDPPHVPDTGVREPQGDIEARIRALQAEFQSSPAL
jgi:hypothetical protein